MNASNAIGYLAGALLAAQAMRAAGAFRTMLAGVWVCVFAVLACAFLSETIALNLARLLAGAGGGFAFVAGGVLASSVAQRNKPRASLFLGLYYAGPGLGIFLSGLVVPTTLENLGPASWRYGWAMLGIICLILAFGLLRARGVDVLAVPTRHPTSRQGRMHWLMGGYVLFGAGYIAYMTFMIAWVQSSDRGGAFQALFWMVIGSAAMASPWLLRIVLERCLNGYAFALLTGMTAVGALLPLLSNTVVSLLTSATLFGSTFFAVVAATTAFVRRNFPQGQWAAAIGGLTAAFGVGQTLGPIAIGFLNDVAQNMSVGHWASVCLLVIAALLACQQRDFRSA